MSDGGEEDQPDRKGTGPTTLEFLDTLQPGQRLQVESCLNSPVGPNSTYMTTYIIHIAKDGNVLPLTVSNWTQMPAEFLLNAMLEVKKVFDYPDDLNDWIRAKLNDSWWNHKHFVKKEGFYKYTTQEERLANRPKDVVESQWGALVEYWKNLHEEEKCAKNQENRSKQIVQQSSGSKPHVKYVAESLVSSSKKMKMSAEASGSQETNAVSRHKPEHRLLSRCNAVPTSPVPLIQAASHTSEDSEDNMQAWSDDSFEDFGYIGGAY